MAETSSNPNKLKRTLGPFMLWGLGVGYVISGMYFGWNLGLEKGGTLGLGIATVFIIIMYVTFTFSYTEMACAIPKAGGAFVYADRGLGKKLGFLAGMAQNIEFVFAPPAIAYAIGAYFQSYFPEANVELIAIVAYFIFTTLNIVGVKAAASFELVITILAVVELLIFAGVCLPEFKASNLTLNAYPHGLQGAFAAIPFAIWFFLAIEGVANVAEEVIHPQKNISIGFGSAIFTLVVLCILTFIAAVGVNGWESIVYVVNEAGVAEAKDTPLPLAIKHVVGDNAFLFHLLITVGLLGLVASFHGIILAAGRATFEFGRVGYIPKVLGKVHPKAKTPANALIVNMLIGIVAILTGQTGDIIIIACFGALVLYIISMLSFFALRKKEPDLERPYKVPLFPAFPAIALVIAIVAFISMAFSYPIVGAIFGSIMALSYLYFIIFVDQSEEI